MNLQTASEIATQLLDYMSPECERIEVAGSIRRGKSEVKDIELVCIPRFEQKPVEFSLLGEHYNANLLWERVHHSEFISWIKPGCPQIEAWSIKPDGKYWRGLIPQGKFGAPADIKLDLFFARPTNWGVIYLIRTGSDDFSRAFVTHVRDKTPLLHDKGDLWEKATGKLIECRSEEELFASVNLQWVEPRARIGDKDIHQLID